MVKKLRAFGNREYVASTPPAHVSCFILVYDQVNIESLICSPPVGFFFGDARERGDHDSSVV